MKRFKVQVTQQTQVSQVFTVEAEDEEEAKNLALDAAGIAPDGWELDDDWPSDDAYDVADVWEADGVVTEILANMAADEVRAEREEVQG